MYYDSYGQMDPLSSLLVLALFVVIIVGLWKTFAKADEPGWKALIPFYNTYTLFRIAGRNGWLFLLLLVPLVNIVISIIVMLDLAKHYGRGVLFGIFGLILFPYVGFLILGFGSDEYVGPKHD